MSLVSRALTGAVAGGITGGMQSDWSLGGMMAGAAVGSVGFAAGGGLLNKAGGITGLAQKYGTGMLAKNSLGTAEKYAARMKKFSGKKTGADFLAAQEGHIAATKSAAGWKEIGETLGRNSIAINQYGGLALGAMGAVSAGSIGNSMIRSNRGYRR